MKKEEMIRFLKEKDSTVLSFPDRGAWGDSAYRGNCSGWIHAFLIWKYKVEKMAELFAGSGTGYDVAKDMEIYYTGIDLNPVPVRPGILSLDAVSDEVPDSFYDADFLFLHPPYGAEIGIPYAGYQFPDVSGELALKDLGQMKWKTFMKTLNAVLMKYYAAMPKGALMSVLIGDVRRNGRFYSMFTDIVKPGELQQVFIKRQHHVCSGGRKYLSHNFAPIEHEYLMVLKKIGSYLLSFQFPKRYELDIRDSSSATWRDVVSAVLEVLGKKARLHEIYREVEGYKKAELNPHWKEKVRQTLQKYQNFTSSERGVWRLVS